MNRSLLILIVVLCFASCATPVIRKDLLDQSQKNVPPGQIISNPSPYMGKLFVLGGLIVSTSLVEEGSMIEVVYLPVNSKGSIQQTDRSEGRFLAFYPKEKGVLDPLVYRQGRQITLAGVLVDLRNGTIGQMNYVFPVFRIEQLYLWDEQARPAYPNTFFNFGLFGVIR